MPRVSGCQEAWTSGGPDVGSCGRDRGDSKAEGGQGFGLHLPTQPDEALSIYIWPRDGGTPQHPREACPKCRFPGPIPEDQL